MQLVSSVKQLVSPDDAADRVAPACLLCLRRFLLSENRSRRGLYQLPGSCRCASLMSCCASSFRCPGMEGEKLMKLSKGKSRRINLHQVPRKSLQHQRHFPGFSSKACRVCRDSQPRTPEESSVHRIASKVAQAQRFLRKLVL